MTEQKLQYSATQILRWIAEGYVIIESDGERFTMQSPDDEGPQEVLVDVREYEAAVNRLLAAPPAPSDWRSMESADKLADAWTEERGVRAMVEAVGDVFSKWADADLLSRFHDQIEALLRQSFLEGVTRAAPSPDTGKMGGEALVEELRMAACGLFQLKNERGDYGYFNDLADRVAALSRAPVSGGEGEAVAWLDELEGLADDEDAARNNYAFRSNAENRRAVEATKRALCEACTPPAIKRLIAMARTRSSDSSATERMRAERDLWVKIAEALRPHVQHDETCELTAFPMRRRCDCGVSRAIKAYLGARAALGKA